MGSLYFKNREQAGAELAEQLTHAYTNTDSVILALGPGSGVMAIPIAERLLIPLYMFAWSDIELPGDFHEKIGAVDQGGSFAYDSDISEGQQADIYAEFHGHIESKKTEAMHDINRQASKVGLVDRKNLSGKAIFIACDGMKRASSLDAVTNFLKPVDPYRIISLMAVASIEVIDRLHLATDEIHILSPKQNYLETNHYFESNDLPSEDYLRERIKKINDQFAYD